MSPFSLNYSLAEMIQMGIALVVIVSGLLAVIYSLWGGFLLITSGGNEEKVKPAVNHIRHAVLGLIVLILILFITPRFLNLFGLPFAEELTPSKIFGQMKTISASIFSTNSSQSDTLDNTNMDPLGSDFTDL